MENQQIVIISEKFLIRYLKNRWGIEEEIIPQSIQLLIKQGKIVLLPDNRYAVLPKKYHFVP